jgi:hypothetical protein
MSFWNSLFGLFGAASASDSEEATCSINPASGLPMVGGCGGLDVAGNPYGTDTHTDMHIDMSHADDAITSFSSDDSSSSSFSSWDD